MTRRETPWGCHTGAPLHHPWLPIPDVACGYMGRLEDGRCHGCHRARDEAPIEQLAALRGVGDVELGKAGG